VIHDASTFPAGTVLRADLCIVGSGPGGSTAAAVAAEAGLRVVVLEAGDFLTPGDMNQREDRMLPRLLWENGGRASKDKQVRIHQGRGVGGSSLHNLNLCKRIPASMRARWAKERGLDAVPWDSLYDEVEALLSVSDVRPDQVNRANSLLRDGANALGWKNGPLRHNRTGCIGSGFCELGCAYDAKNHALKVFVPRAVRASASFVTHAQAIRVLHEGGSVSGVDAAILDPATRDPIGRLRVDAACVCLSASATGTPALLLRSRVPDPSGETGKRLRIHPAVVVAGDFPEAVRAWEGVPQSWEVTEFLDLDDEQGRRTWIVPAFAHPMGVATLVPGWGASHRAVMERYAYLDALTAMIHDLTVGSVTPRGELGLHIDYRLGEDDRRELQRGLRECVELLFAAGATTVHVPATSPLTLTRGDSFDALAAVTSPDLSAVHPMGSVPMGADPAKSAVSPSGRHHHVDGLYIADGSLFPGSIGVPPQLSIYAMGLHVGRAIATGSR
jgi:choline dehydrogenase-like flavoprotein